MTCFGVILVAGFFGLGFGMVLAMIADGDAFDPGSRTRGR